MKRHTGDGAVFARNHRIYLEHAQEVAKVDPRTLVTFRSRQEWKRAEQLLADSDEVPIYFAIVDEGPEIRFKARLRKVLLHPKSGDEETDQLLRLAPPRTEGEGLWNEEVGTLYVVSGCEQLRETFPITHLVKLSDGEPIAENYRYSYSLVRATNDMPVRSLIASDLSEPPLRVETRINRIVRDTALVQRLKTLHDHRCQHCETRLDLPDGSAYSEGHHLKPLGSPHDGPDVPQNVLILCPNCHALLDLCAVFLDHTRLRHHRQHEISSEFIEYHNRLCQKWRSPN